MSGGELLSDDLNANDYAAVSDGTADGMFVGAGYSVGQYHNANLHLSWLSYFVFDTSSVVGPTDAQIRVTVAASHADPALSADYNACDFCIAWYDNDTADLDAGDWLTPAGLSALTTESCVSGVGVGDGDTVSFLIDVGVLNLTGRTRFIMFTDKQVTGTSPDDGPGTVDEEYWQLASVALFVDDVEVVPPGPDPDPGDTACVTVAVPGFLADGATADANGIVYTPTVVGGWWDSIPLRSATSEVQPRGEFVTVAQELGREVELVIVAHAPGGQTALGPALCFTAMETIKAAFRIVFVPVAFQVVDPYADRTAQARRVGPIKQTILGKSVAVRSSIPLLAPDPRRFPTP